MQINSFLKLTKSEWRYWLTLVLLSFITASLFVSGWPKGLVPEVKTPFIYAGDGLAYIWNIQRALEGLWYFENARSGYPFGSNHLDYPTADTGSYLIIKFLGLLFHTAAASLNLYFLLGFAICAAISYLVSRSLGLTKPFAITCAIIYTFSSFHFGRVGHLFFTAYFVAPIFFYFGFRLVFGNTILSNPSATWQQKLIYAACIIATSSFGLYYDFFGCIVIAICTVISFVIQRSWMSLKEGLLTLCVVVFGVLLNTSPSLLYLWKNGESSEGINRFAEESEFYGLRVTQMLLPRGDHRLDSFANFASRYNNHFPFVTENVSASLGLVTSVGFVLLIMALFTIPFSRQSSEQFQSTLIRNKLHLKLLLCAVLALGLTLMGTIGGGASLFALLVSTSFRAWNRVSIFIAFISILGLLLAIQLATLKAEAYKNQLLWQLSIAFILIVVGLYDQTVRPCHSCLAGNRALMKNDIAFIEAIEASLPTASAIYQLPYMSYSDAAPVNGLGSYDQARGHLHSKNLRWSFGGVRGRVGDWFFRKLATLPIEQQVVVIQSMGFAGIYVDKRGYMIDSSDERCSKLSKTKLERIIYNCMTVQELQQDLAAAVGDNLFKKSTISLDQQLVFYPVNTSLKGDLQNIIRANDFLAPIGFKLENGIPVQIEGGFEVPLDFRTDDPLLPAYVGGLKGLSKKIIVVNGERVGRWSDAHQAKHVSVWLAKPLPKSFTLEVRAQAAGLNAGKPLKVKVGKQIKEMIFGAEFSTQTLQFEPSEFINKIEFIPADPFSPARRWGTADTIMLAVQFQQLSIKTP